MDSKQFDALLGISRNMEKSLQGIEKSLGATKESAGKSSGVLAGLSQSLGALVASLSVKKFDSKKANDILDFSRGLVQIANSVDAEASKAFGEFATGLADTFDVLTEVMSPMKMLKLAIASKVLFGEKEGKDSLLKKIVKGMTSAFKDMDTKTAKEGAEAIKFMGEGLLSLTKALKGFILIGLAAPLVAIGALVVRGVIALFSSFGKHAKEIEEGGNALKALGKGLVVFSAGLATLMLVSLIVGPKIMIGLSMIALFGLTFWALGKAADSITRGAKAVALMGLALFGFSAAIATYMLVLLIVKPALLLLGMALIAAFGVVFYLLGKASQGIAEGALAMVAMGFGLAFFGLGLMFFGLVVKMYTVKDLLMGALIIAEFGMAMFLLGKFAKQITSGAIVMAEMGVGLGIFAVGALLFAAAVKLYELKDIVIGAMLIAAIGISTAIVGAMSGAIGPGALALAQMGVGLAIFSVGLIVFGLAIKTIQALFDDLSEAGMIAAGIIIGLGVAFMIVGVMSPAIIPGAGAVAAMGVGLAVFSVGLIVFGLAIKALQAMFDDLAEAGKIAGSIIIGLGLAFTIVGVLSPLIIMGSAAVAAMGVGLILFSFGAMIFAGAVKILTKVFDTSLDKIGDKMSSFFVSLGWAFSGIGLMLPLVILGSASLMLMGTGLMVMSGGLMIFAGTMNYIKEKGLFDEKDGVTTLKGISVLSGLASEISAIGWYAMNPLFYMGVVTSIGLGVSLATIGMGLSVAANALNQVKDMDKLIDNLFGDGGLIPTMAEAFAGIGNKYGGGFLSSWLGADPVSMGIRVTRGFGEVLSELAGGIVAFANFSEFPVKVPDPKDPSKLIYSTVNIFSDIIPALNANLPILLTTLASTFASIGELYGGDGGWFGDDSPVAKGVNAVRGIGSVLGEVAGGIVAFSRFEEFPIQIPDPKDPSKLIYKSVNLWDTIPKIKQGLVGDGRIQGKLTGKTGILMSLAEVFAEIGNKYGDGFFSDGPVKAGVDAVKGIGGVISDLAAGILAFANMERGLPNYGPDGKFNGTYTKFSLQSVKENITRVLTSLPGVFANIDIDAMEEAQDKAKIAVPLAESISKVGKALQSLIVDKKGGEKESLVALIGPGINQIVKDMEKVEIDDDMIKKLNDLSKPLDKFSRMGDGLKTFASGLSEAGKAFTVFGSGFSKFSSQLDRFMKFEKAFSALSYNAYTYKFDKFAQSMGTLKENVNAFNVENLKMTDSLMKSLAILSKAPDSVGAKIKESIDEAMAELIKAIEKLADNAGSGGGGGTVPVIAPPTGGGITPPAGGGGKTPTGAGGDKGGKQPQDMTQVIMALNDVKNAINTLNGKFKTGSKGGILISEL